ncbi:MAG: 5'-3' exonuclease H3TH domain-containing protein [Thermoanaerobaculia bacterium]
MATGIRLLLVDGLNLIRRVYAAQPGEDGPEKADAGRESATQSLRRALRETSPTHAVVVLEGPEPTWRHRLFPAYKEGHPPMPPALADALPGYREAFAGLGVSSFELPGVEADDVVGTLAVKTAGSGGEAVILSTDRIFLQLLSGRVRVRDHFASRDLDRGGVLDRFGVEPERLLDLLALTGDSGNGIPGVPGVGPKTAAKLLDAHGSLEAILTVAAAEPTELSPKLAAKLRDHAADARLARSLVALRTDLELGLNLRDLRLTA